MHRDIYMMQYEGDSCIVRILRHVQFPSNVRYEPSRHVSNHMGRAKVLPYSGDCSQAIYAFGGSDYLLLALPQIGEIPFELVAQ